MAYFRKEIDIAVPCAHAWEALRDVGALHTRLVRGFVLECEFDGRARRIKFANGLTTVERIIAVSDEDQRVSWTAASERLEHHNASAQVRPIGPDSCAIAWTVDLLPDGVAPAIASMVDAGLAAMKATLESDASVS
jgi:hypothetical protein